MKGSPAFGIWNDMHDDAHTGYRASIGSNDVDGGAPNRENLADYYGGRAKKAIGRREPNNANSFARAAAHHALELLGRVILRGRGGCSNPCRRADHHHETDVDTASYFAGDCACGLV